MQAVEIPGSAKALRVFAFIIILISILVGGSGILAVLGGAGPDGIVLVAIGFGSFISALFMLAAADGLEQLAILNARFRPVPAAAAPECRVAPPAPDLSVRYEDDGSTIVYREYRIRVIGASDGVRYLALGEEFETLDAAKASVDADLR